MDSVYLFAGFVAILVSAVQSAAVHADYAARKEWMQPWHLARYYRALRWKLALVFITGHLIGWGLGLLIGGGIRVFATAAAWLYRSTL